jgi:hypothetical protein
VDQAVGALLVVLDELAQRGKDVVCGDVNAAVGLADAVMKDLALVADGDGMLAGAALALAHKKAAVDAAAEQILGRGAGDLAGEKEHVRLAFEIGENLTWILSLWCIGVCAAVRPHLAMVPGIIFVALNGRHIVARDPTHVACGNRLGLTPMLLVVARVCGRGNGVERGVVDVMVSGEEATWEACRSRTLVHALSLFIRTWTRAAGRPS